MNILDTLNNEKMPLKDGAHVAKLKSCEMKLTRAQDEYISLSFVLADGDSVYINLFFHTEGALRMSAPQLKKSLLTEKLPIYKSVNDLLTDKSSFIRKVESAFCSLVGKKFEIKAETYFSKKQDKNVQNVYISGFLDMPNEAIQSPQAKQAPAFNQDEKIPF